MPSTEKYAHRIPDGTIVRRIEIGKAISFKALLEKSKRQQTNGCGLRKDFNEGVLKNVPTTIMTGEVEIHFVPTNKIIRPADLDAELSKLGYLLIDPSTLLAFNNFDQDFADRFPHATQWKCKDGHFFCLVFDRNLTDESRRMVLDEIINSWSSRWYMACTFLH